LREGWRLGRSAEEFAELLALGVVTSEAFGIDTG